MTTVRITPLGLSPDERGLNIRIQVESEPPGIRRITILDRTRRRLSGLADTSATFEIAGCPLTWDQSFNRVLLEFFPLYVEVVQCNSGQSGITEISGPFPLPDAGQVPPAPDCSDATRRLMPSRECLQANRDADVARRAADEACANLRALTSAQDDLRRQYNGHIMRWLTLTAAAAAAAFVPLLGYAPAIVISIAAIALLVLALRAAYQASNLNDRVADAQHRWDLCQARFTEASVRVTQACCSWERTSIDLAPQCQHPPPWFGSFVTGRIGEPGG